MYVESRRCSLFWICSMRSKVLRLYQDLSILLTITNQVASMLLTNAAPSVNEMQFSLHCGACTWCSEMWDCHHYV